MRSKARIIGRGAAGQALVEFAFILPIFLLLIMGTVDLGRGILFYNMVSSAARESARVGVVPTNTRAGMCTQAMAQIQAPGVGSSSGCSSIADASTTAFGTLSVKVHLGTAGSTSDLSTVTLTYSFQPITPLIGTLSIPLTATSSMYVEQ